MLSSQVWIDKIPDRDGEKSSVLDLAYSPDGSKLIVAAGSRVLVYNAWDGSLIKTLKSHKDTVYCVAFADDGELFASGAADKTVILWTIRGEGILKYSHSESIQHLCFNPVTKVLVSCTATDFGMCVVESKSVNRQKVESKILCCDWTFDGQYLALGMQNGSISIHDQNGEEKVVIQRNAPIWTIAWNPSRKEPVHNLAVGSWDNTISFYQVNGLQVGKDKNVGFDPCSLSYIDDGTYLLVGGSDREMSLYAKGVKLGTLFTMDDWCWSCKGARGKPFVACGGNDGTVAVQELSFTPVNSLYDDRFASTEGLTDVVVQHLVSEQRVRIKSREMVKKVAVYKNRLAVQQPDKIIVYELTNALDPFDLRYRVRDKIPCKLECSLMVVTHSHIIMCNDTKLQLINFMGTKEKEWSMDCTIRYMRVIGGGPGREGLLVGLKNGHVYQVFVDNPFPIILIKHSAPVMCLDMNRSREKLAIVDGNSNCVVYNLRSGEQIYTEPNASSVSWNSEIDDMLCFGGTDVLHVKTGTFPAQQQPVQGIVVAFRGTKVFCIQSTKMESVDIPQSVSFGYYVEAKDFERAYHIACLGATESDWRMLAIAALQNMSLDIARKAFIRIRDVKYLDLINKVELELNRTVDRNQALGLQQAKVYAYEGKYQEAAKLFSKLGVPEKAIDMFSDLRLWEEAKNFASRSGNLDVAHLVERQAEWAKDTGDWKLASEMFCAAGQYNRAIEMVGNAGNLDELIEIARSIDSSNTSALQRCAQYFIKAGHHQYAKEVYLKLNDIQALMKLHVNLYKWEEAFLLCEQHGGKFAEDVYLPYAQWLVENDRFDEAQSAFKRAEQPEKSMKMLKQLSRSALVEQRFVDAGYYLFLLSQECLGQVAHDSESLSRKDIRMLSEFEHFRSLGMQYFAYIIIYKYTVEPFNSFDAESVFNAARYLMNSHSATAIPYGISRAAVLWALGKHGDILGAYKLARTAYDRLGNLRIPDLWQRPIDTETMIVHSKPFQDMDEHFYVCYRCSTTNPLINSGATGLQGDVCIQCGHPFIRSAKSFDLLPLVEFVPEGSMSDAETMSMLNCELAIKGGASARDSETKGADRLNLEDEGSYGADPFADHMLTKDFSKRATRYRPLEVPAEVLKQMNINEVFILKWKCKGKRWQFYKNIIPDVRISMCNGCFCFFHEEDLEKICLTTGNKCPVCKTSIDM